MLKLKLQNFGHQMQKADSPERTLVLEKIEGRRRRGWPRMRCLDGIIDSMDMNLSKLWEIEKDREVWHASIHGAEKSQTLLSDWIATAVLWTVPGVGPFNSPATVGVILLWWVDCVPSNFICRSLIPSASEYGLFGSMVIASIISDDEAIQE